MTVSRASNSLRHIPYMIAGVFSTFSLLWIFLSDRLLLRLSADLTHLTALSTLKGLFYVVVTALILFLSSRWAIDHVVRREERLKQKHLEARTQLQAIVNASPMGVALIEHAGDICLFVGGAGQILDANPAAVQFYGYSLEELRRLSVFDLRAQPLAFVETSLGAASAVGHRHEAVHRRRDGQEAAVEVTTFDAEREGQRIVVCMVRDVTPRKRQLAYRELVHRLDRAVLEGASVEEIMAVATDQPSPWLAADSADAETLELVGRQIEGALAQAERQRRLKMLEAALQATVNGVVITDAMGQIEWINPAFTKLTGFTAEEALGQTPRILNSGSQSEAFYRRMWQSISEGNVWQGEIRNRRKDGTLYDEEMTITPVPDPAGRIQHFVAIKTDATQRKEREEQIERLRTTDATTGLMNRSRLLSVVADMDIPSEGAALVILEIAQLEQVNMSMGSEARDQLLMHVARVITQVAEPYGFAARLREDGFAIVVRGSITEGEAAAELVRQRLAGTPLTISGMTVELSLSAGVAPLSAATSLTDAQLQAEQALAEAKRLGGSRCLVFAPAMVEFHDLMHWSSALRQALRDGGFELHYQPVVRLSDRRTDHAEALIRMRGTDGTLLYPSQFLAIAERLNLISRIDEWVIEEVIKRLREYSSLRLFVNLSGQSLNDMEMLAKILSRLEGEPETAHRITFEITESIAIRNVSATRAWMSSMQSLGVHFALDDFGTGYSSFAYLRDLPVEYVKVDGSFIRGIESDLTIQAVVGPIIEMARSLGKRVVAEWVENEQVAILLTEMGVTFGQGSVLGMPSPDLSWALRD